MLERDAMEQMTNKLTKDLFIDFSKKYCDPSAGTGDILLYIFGMRLQYTQTPEEGIIALSTLYGIEPIESNVKVCHDRLRNALVEWHGNMADDFDKFLEAINKILEHNIVCSDFLDWDIDNWCSLKKE